MPSWMLRGAAGATGLLVTAALLAYLPATADADNLIHITFVIHFDPLPAPGGTVLRQGYEAERDNLAWLAAFLERIEQEKGIEFVPRLHLQMAGDHAEFYREDDEGFALLKRLHDKGIHTFGTHFHRNYKTGPHLWPSGPDGLAAPMDMARRVTQDHIAEVDQLVGKLIGSNDPAAIRRANHAITGHLVDAPLAQQMGFDLLTGGSNEAMNLFFDHDVYNPWRPARGWPLGEDPANQSVLIPQAPVLGAIGEHSPLPPGVSEEYTQGMRAMVWQDLSVPAMRRKFLHLYLEWREQQRQGKDKVWVFGWHEHTNDLFPSGFGPKRGQRDALVAFVEWLNANFIGKPGARYSNTDEVQEQFLTWERAHPGESSFSYPSRERDWAVCPYTLKGLAWALMFAHHEEELGAFHERGVHAHRLSRAEGRYWELRGDEVVCTAPTEDVYLLWSDRGEVTVDFSAVLEGTVRVLPGGRGEERLADARELAVPDEPIVVRSAQPGATARAFESSPFGFHPASTPPDMGGGDPFGPARDIGVRWHRPPVYAFWFLCQPAAGEGVAAAFNWERLDGVVREVPDGINILWNLSARNYTRPQSFLPADWEGYKRYVRAVVERYDGDGTDDAPGCPAVHHWQVENEPNLPHSEGQPEEYAELLRHTYEAAKQADPNCKIVIGGVGGWVGAGPGSSLVGFRRFYVPVLKSLNGAGFDTFDYHWYGNATGEYRGYGEVHAEVRAALDAAGFRQAPIWITEMGSYSGDPADNPPQTEEQQAADVVKRYVYPLSLGVEKVFWAFGLAEGFKQDDRYFDHTGLIYDGRGSSDRGRGVRKLAYHTFKAMTEKLEGKRFVAEVPGLPANVYGYRFEGEGGSVAVVWWDWWNEPGVTVRPVSVPAAGPTVMTSAVTAPDGTRHWTRIEPDEGTVALVLGQSPVFLEPAAPRP